MARRKAAGGSLSRFSGDALNVEESVWQHAAHCMPLVDSESCCWLPAPALVPGEIREIPRADMDVRLARSVRVHGGIASRDRVRCLGRRRV